MVPQRGSLQRVANGLRIENFKENELSIMYYLVLKIAFYAKILRKVITRGGKVRNFSITSGSTSTVAWINNMGESNYI